MTRLKSHVMKWGADLDSQWSEKFTQGVCWRKHPKQIGSWVNGKSKKQHGPKPAASSCGWTRDTIKILPLWSKKAHIIWIVEAQIISSAHGCPAPTATDGEKSHILVRYITLFLLLKFCWLLSPCRLSVTPPVVEVITVVVVVVVAPVAVVVAVVPLPATTCRHICHPWTWGLANRMWDIDRNNLLRCGILVIYIYIYFIIILNQNVRCKPTKFCDLIWWYTSKKVQNTKDIAWGFGRSKTGRWEAHIPKKCWLSGSSWSWERRKNINHHETSNGYLI